MALLVAAVIVVLVGCGVAPQDEATRLPASEVPFDLLAPEPSAAPTTAPTEAAAALYFVSGDRLKPVFRNVAADATPADVIRALVDGPTAAEIREGLRTALPESIPIRAVTVSRGVATVSLGTSASDIRSGDQALSVAQIVFTLTARPGIGRVMFKIDGQPIEVPDGSGALTADAVVREDFIKLAPPRA